MAQIIHVIHASSILSSVSSKDSSNHSFQPLLDEVSTPRVQ